MTRTASRERSVTCTGYHESMDNPPAKRESMNWREHIRIIALIVNGLSIMLLIGSRAWWMTLGFDLPLIVAPVLAVIALAVNRPRDGG